MAASAAPGDSIRPAADPGPVLNLPPELATADAGGPGLASPVVPADLDTAPPVVLVSGPVVGVLGPGTATLGTRPSPRSARSAPPGVARRPAEASTTANAGVAEAARPGQLTQQAPEGALADAIARAERLAAGQPADFSSQFQLRMLYLAAGRTRQAQAPWPAGSPEQRKTLSAWVAAAVALGSKQTGAVAPGESALEAVERLRRQLADQAPLRIRTVKLVSRVDGFGVITPFKDDVCRPSQWVIVYCEVENLISRLADDGLHHTELSLRVEVLSAAGKSMLEQEDKRVVDRSLNQRRDFFLARRLRMPGHLTTGHYVLRVSVEDKQAAKVGESMLRFRVK